MRMRNDVNVQELRRVVRLRPDQREKQSDDKHLNPKYVLPARKKNII